MPSRHITLPPDQRRDYAMLPPLVSAMRGSAPKVWAALYERGAEVLNVTVSLQSLARDACISRQTVRRALDSLIDAGYVQQVRAGRPASYRISQRPLKRACL